MRDSGSTCPATGSARGCPSSAARATSTPRSSTTRPDARWPPRRAARPRLPGVPASWTRPGRSARNWPSEPRRPESRPWSWTAVDTDITGGFARSPRAPARAASTCRAEESKMARIDPAKLNLEEKVVQINRVAKVVKGGRRFSFSAVVVVGDHNGVVGAGLGKSNEVPEAIRKGVEDAKKRLIRVPLVGSTIPHAVSQDFGASTVLLKPASAGTGVIAGGSVRSVVEAAGIRDLLSKSMGSTNPVNVVRAAMECLQALRSADE